MTGIYKITFKNSDRHYVGSSQDCEKRKRQHLWALRNNRHANTHLQNAYNFYGEEALEFSFICSCEEPQLLLLEAEFIDKFNSYEDGYNLVKDPSRGNYGYRHTEKAKKIMSQKKKGKKSSTSKFTDEEVFLLREKHFQGEKIQHLASAYNVTRNTIARIVNYQSYLHVERINLEHKKMIEEKFSMIESGEHPGFNYGGSHTEEFKERFRKAVTKPNYSKRLFTPEQIREIRKDKKEGYSYSQLKEKYEVSVACIQKIIKKETYKEVE